MPSTCYLFEVSGSLHMYPAAILHSSRFSLAEPVHANRFINTHFPNSHTSNSWQHVLLVEICYGLISIIVTVHLHLASSF